MALATPVFDIPDAPSRWPRVAALLSPLVILLPALLLAWNQGQFLLERSLRLALGEGTLRYGVVLPGTDASLRSRGFRFESTGGAVLEATRVEVSSPGWLWLLRNAVRRPRLDAPLDRLQLRFAGVRVAPGSDPSLGQLGPFGMSGSPFESLGCPSAAYWGIDALHEAEFDTEAAELTFRFMERDGMLESRIAYELPGASRVERLRLQKLPVPLSLLVVDQYPASTVSEQWQVDDQAFIRTRNRTCGTRGDPRAVVERNALEARQLAESAALHLPTEAWLAYRRFVRDGGSLQLLLRYAEPLPVDDWFGVVRDPDTLQAATISFNRGEQQLTLRLQAPLPGQSLSLTPTGQTLQADRLDLTGSQWLAPERAREALNPQPQAAELPPPVEAVRPSPAPVATPTVTTRPPQPSPTPPPSGSTPQAPRSLAWEDLPRHVGKRIRVSTAAGSPRNVDLVSAGPDEIVVRSRMGGGVVESRIQRRVFRNALLLEP